MDPASAFPTVAIGVATFHRTERLRTLLPRLLAQLSAVDGRGSVRNAGVIVVDNDPGGSAGAVVQELGDDAVRYAVEPLRGISHARNLVLDLAATSDLLAFIDDDEIPLEGWLQSLVDTQARTSAAAVAGPVVSEAVGEFTPFVAQGGFLDRSHRDGLLTGSRIDRAATNNLLLDLRWTRRHGLRFDERFGLTGGEDSVFTSTLTRLGGHLVWCAEAVVIDPVPAARMTPEYVLGKACAIANTEVFVELALLETRRQRIRYRGRELVRQVARTGQGVGLLARSRIRRSAEDRARGARALWRARGALLALTGHRPQQYSSAPGSDARPSTIDGSWEPGGNPP